MNPASYTVGQGGGEHEPYKGYLVKAPPLRHRCLLVGMAKKWRQRWFVLIPDEQTLHYYSDETEAAHCGTINLGRCYDIRTDLNDKRRPHMFGVRTPEREYLLVAGSDQQMQEWLTRIQRVCRANKATRKSTRVPYGRSATTGDTSLLSEQVVAGGESRNAAVSRLSASPLADRPVSSVLPPPALATPSAPTSQHGSRQQSVSSLKPQGSVHSKVASAPESRHGSLTSQRTFCATYASSHGESVFLRLAYPRMELLSAADRCGSRRQIASHLRLSAPRLARDGVSLTLGRRPTPFLQLGA